MAQSVLNKKIIGLIFLISLIGLIGLIIFWPKSKVPQARFDHDKAWVSFQAENLKAEKIVKAGDKTIYKNVSQNTDISYEKIPNGLKETIILNKPGSNNNYSFILSYPSNLTYQKEAGTIAFYDKSENYQFHIEKPFMEDKNGSRSEEIVVSINNAKSDKNNISNIKYTLTPSQKWLTDKARKYPIIIDPTVIYDTDNPPKAFWNFDEGSGLTANDSSGNANAGTLTNSPTRTSFGKIGSAIDFNGSNNYVSVGTPASLDMDGAMTVEAWVYSDTASSGWCILCDTTAAGLSGQYQLQFQGTDTNRLRFGWGNGTTAANFDSTSQAQQINQWQHVAATRDASNNVKLYLNGVELAGSFVTGGTGTAKYASPQGISIGRNGAYDGSYFNGKIDEVKIYNSARSARQIAMDYNAGGPIVWLKFDEGYGSTSDTQKNITPSISGATFQDGKIGKSLHFNGSSDFVNLSSPTVIDDLPANDFTISSWIYDENTAGNTWGTILGAYRNITGGWNLRTLSNAGGARSVYFDFTYNTTPAAYRTNDGTIPVNTWTHVAAVWSAATKTAKIYINGVEPGYQTSTQGVGTYASDASLNKQIGRIEYHDQYFNGRIDDFKIFKYALTSDEIKKEANLGGSIVAGQTKDVNRGGVAPVGFWDFNEGSGASANDKSGNANTGTLSGATWTNQGKTGNALSFNGSSNYVSIGTPSILDLDAAMTVEAWVKPADTVQGCVVCDSSGGLSGQYQLMFNNGGSPDGVKLVFAWGNGTTAANYRSTNNVKTVGQWQHITAVRDSGKNVTLYVNGILVPGAFDTGGTGTAIYSSPRGIAIGQNGVSNSTYFNGLIDQVKIYNYARTIDQIHADMMGSPITWLKFDEGQGSIAYDSQKNYNGTISAATWTDGKFGKALSFNGSSSYVDISIPTPTMPLTIEFWANPTTSTPIGMFDSASGQANVLRNYPNGYVEWWNATPQVSLGLTANIWQHLAFVFRYSGSNRYIDYYKNGVLQTTGSASGSTTFAWTTFTLGNINDGGAGWYSGKLDELKVYNYALTTDEIKMEANQGAALSLGKNIDSNAGGANPVAFWDFNDGSGTTTKDTSGNNHAGTVTAATWTNQGKSGSALNFSGSNDAHVQITTSSGLSEFSNPQSAFTLEAWIKTTDNSAGVQRKVYANSTEDGWHNLFVLQGTVYMKVMRSVWTAYDCGAYNYPVNDGKWHHVVGVFNNPSGAVYIDGAKRSNCADFTGSILSSGGWGNGGVKIGSDYYNPTPTELFIGSIDQVKVYNYARSDRQIAFDYNNGQPSSWWRLDEKTGLTAYNSTDATVSGSLQGSMTDSDHVPGKVGYALDFDGSNDYVTMGNIYNFERTDPFTITAWFKTSSATDQQIAGKSNNGTPWNGYYLRLLNTGALDFALCNSGVTGDIANIYTNSTFKDGRWHHVAATSDGSASTNGMKIYVDGSQAAITVARDALTATIQTSYPFQISGRNSASANIFNGLIDEVKVYNYARTSEEVKMDYTGGAINFK